MAHFGKINSENIVEEVLVVPDEQEHRGEEYLHELGKSGTFIQTSYNSNMRKQFAGVGMMYDSVNDIFILEKPHPSWILTEDFDWKAPVEKPDSTNIYVWDEESISWILQSDTEDTENTI